MLDSYVSLINLRFNYYDSLKLSFGFFPPRRVFDKNIAESNGYYEKLAEREVKILLLVLFVLLVAAFGDGKGVNWSKGVDVAASLVCLSYLLEVDALDRMLV